MARSATFLLLAFVSLLITSCGKQTAAPETPRPVRTLVVTADQQHLMAEYAGSIVARVESQLSFRVAGKIQARKVDVGSQVKVGQLLMQLDAQDLTLGLSQAQASVRTAQTNYELAELELKRFRDLQASGAISLSAVDAKNAAFEAAKAALEQSQALLGEQKNQTQYASLKADMDGVVTAVEAEIGQVVAAGFPVIKLAQLSAQPYSQANNQASSDLEMAIEIPENNLALINKAETIEIQLWASSKEVFRGRIREIAPAADPISRAFSAKISFLDITEKQQKLLKLGMTASAKFLLTTPQAYVKVPLSALLQSQGQTQVWRVVQGRAQPSSVTIAGINGNDVLIKGLEPGQTIITAGVHVLTAGQAVSLLPEVAKPIDGAAPISAQAIMAPATSPTVSPQTQASPAPVNQAEN
jgi:membrane fusion protein, multidrug efflux system